MKKSELIKKIERMLNEKHGMQFKVCIAGTAVLYNSMDRSIVGCTTIDEFNL